MGAMDRRGLKTKPTKPYIKKRRKGIVQQKPELNPEEAEREKWVNDSENPQFVKFREQYRTKDRKEAMKAALIACMGIVTQACEMAGVGRQTHYDWIENDPSYGKALEEAHTRKKDVIDYAYMKLIMQGVPSVVTHGQETLNKDRGFIKRQEVVNSFSGTQNIKIVIPDNDQSDEPPETQPTNQ